MCGIAGMLGDIREGVIKGMLDRIRHRGPDEMGYKIFDENCMGNTRLSVIDIEGGKQPICDAAGKRWVVCNGEIYDYQKMRNAFAKAGYSFKTHSDTEVLLPLFDRKKLDMFEELNGMFAFCLHDQTNHVTILARDHIGIKPLVYTVVNDKIYWASEAKSFYAVPEWQAAPDMNAWHAFLNIRFAPSPHTLFKDVKKVPPGCYLLIQKKKGMIEVPSHHERVSEFHTSGFSIGIYRYYRIRHKQQSLLKFGEAQTQLQDLIQGSVDRQIIADVPVGFYLSGGIDSSALVAFASQKGRRTLNTLCLGFNEPSDENRDAHIVAQQFSTSHQDVFLNDNPLESFREAVYYMEEPKVNCLQGFLLAREAQKYQKVAISGLGGDELFGGYDIYSIASYLDSLSNKISCPIAFAGASVLKKILAPNVFSFHLARRGADILSGLNSPLDLYLYLRNSWDHDPWLRKHIYKKGLTDFAASPVREHFTDCFPQGVSFTEAFMQFEIENKMVDDFLANEDRISMAHGLEVRVPFLDRHLLEFACLLPAQWKIHWGKRKIILKKALHDLLPASVLHKKKHGFTFNPVLQFQKDLGPFARQYLSRKRVEESGVFNYQFVKQILESKPRFYYRWHYFLLWKILGYHLWEDIFIRQRGVFEPTK